VLGLFFGDDEFRTASSAPGRRTATTRRSAGCCSTRWRWRHRRARRRRRPPRERGLVVAGALLHDVGKVEAYEVGAGGFVLTPVRPPRRHVVSAC
jgi:hypothetical protein